MNSKFFAAAVLAAGMVMTPLAASAQLTFTPLVTENFDDATLEAGFDALVKDPADVDANNSTWNPGFDVTTLGAPTPAAGPGGDGLVLQAVSNNVDGVVQVLYQTFEPGAGITDYAAETTVLPYVADANTSSSSVWGGVGVYMDDNAENGYWLELRSDSSTTFGNYASLLRWDAGVSTLLARYYFEVGSGGVSEGDIPDGQGMDSQIIRNPEESATNQWIPMRVVAQDTAGGVTLTIFLDDLNTPLGSYEDTTPPTVTDAGKAIIFQTDPFTSTVDPDDSAGHMFENFIVSEVSGTTSVSEWNLYN